MSSGYSASSDLSTDWLEADWNCCGQFSFGWRRKEGPVNQRQLILKSAKGIPLVPSSAGFISPGQCLHWAACVFSKISETRWATKICCRCSEFRIHCKVVELSVHKCMLLMLIRCSFFKNLAIRDPKTAACSSSLVIVCCLRGATRAFPMTKLTLLFWCQGCGTRSTQLLQVLHTMHHWRRGGLFGRIDDRNNVGVFRLVEGRVFPSANWRSPVKCLEWWCRPILVLFSKSAAVESVVELLLAMLFRVGRIWKLLSWEKLSLCWCLCC